MSSESKAKSPGAVPAPGLSLWIFSRDTLFCLYKKVSYPGFNAPPASAGDAIRQKCEKCAGEYREDGAGEDRDSLHIIKHGGDCCGCAVSKEDGEILCNECGQNLDVLVAEVAFLRMAEALMRAHHALTVTSGLIAHDGKAEHSFRLDHAKDLRFIEETMKLADIDFRPLKPLA